MNIPNAISLARLFAVPVIVWLILQQHLMAAFWLSLVAALSDAVDGIVAKHFQSETVLGGYLDPIADKTLLVCGYVTLGHEGYLPVWLVIMVVFRDALIIGGALLFQTITSTLNMQPLLISKVNPFCQLVMAVGVLGVAGFAVEDHGLSELMAYIVGTTTLASGGAYVVLWTRRAGQIVDSRMDMSREEGD